MSRLIAIAFAGLFFTACSDSDNVAEPTSFAAEMVWSKTFGGSLDEKIGTSVATPDGGLIVIGYTDSDDGDVIKLHASTEILLSRFDASGNLVWTKTIGGSQDDYGMSIIATADGNYAIAGYSGSTDGDVPGSIGMHDFYISKINGNGDILWKRNYGFLSHDHAHKIIATSDGGYFVAGYADYAGIDGSVTNNGEGHSMRSGQHGVGEFFGVKIGASGEFKWFRYFGGTMNDRVNDLVEANDGGILMCGYTESQDFDITDNHGSYDYWVVKLHADGGLHWKKTYGGADIDQAFGIAKTNNNSYIVVGRSNSTDGDISNPLGNFDAWVVHINDHGDLLWQKSFGGNDFDVASAIRKTRDGSFVIAGNTRGNLGENLNKGQNDYWVFEIDNFANTGLHWQRTYGGSGIDIATDVTQTNDGFILTGESQSNDFDVPENKGMNDLWMLRLK
jgi:hypothetical protein